MRLGASCIVFFLMDSSSGQRRPTNANTVAGHNGRHGDRVAEDISQGVGPYPQKELTRLYQTHAKDVYVFGALFYERPDVYASAGDIVNGTAFQVSPNGQFITALHVYRRYAAEIADNKKFPVLARVGLSGARMFQVELVKEFHKADLALLQGHGYPNETFIQTFDGDAPPGGLVATTGYVAAELQDEGQQVRVDQRYAFAMVSNTYVEKGVRRVEIDRNLPHGASGSPIMTLSGYAVAVATEQLRDWVLLDEITTRGVIRRSMGRVLPTVLDVNRDDEDWILDERKQIREPRFLRLPIGFSFGSFLSNVAQDLEDEGVPIIRVAEIE